MAKPRSRQLPKPKVPAKKSYVPSGSEKELLGDDSWVVVKKQKITILIPPMPVTKDSSVPKPEGSLPQPMARIEADHQANCPTIVNQKVRPLPEMELSMPFPTEKAIQNLTKVPASQLITSPNLPSLGHRTMLEDPQVVKSKCQSILGVCRASKERKQCRSFLNRDMSLNPKMRALNLERKLQRAGRLSSWLVSLGLDQFVKIFQGRSVGKFQLVNLTMKKLKNMGEDAVGPRRKLMHTIDCLW